MSKDTRKSKETTRYIIRRNLFGTFNIVELTKTGINKKRELGFKKKTIHKNLGKEEAEERLFKLEKNLK